METYNLNCIEVAKELAPYMKWKPAQTIERDEQEYLYTLLGGSLMSGIKALVLGGAYIFGDIFDRDLDELKATPRTRRLYDIVEDTKTGISSAVQILNEAYQEEGKSKGRVRIAETVAAAVCCVYNNIEERTESIVGAEEERQISLVMYNAALAGRKRIEQFYTRNGLVTDAEIEAFVFCNWMSKALEEILTYDESYPDFRINGDIFLGTRNSYETILINELVEEGERMLPCSEGHTLFHKIKGEVDDSFIEKTRDFLIKRTYALLEEGYTVNLLNAGIVTKQDDKIRIEREYTNVYEIY